MHMVFEEDDSFTCFLTKNIYHQDKSETIQNIKTFLLKYNQYYHFLKAGFYQIEVGYHDKVGTILKITLLDDFGLGDHNIDMKIVFIGKQKIAFELEALPSTLNEFYLYQGKIYLLEEQLGKQNFFNYLEHSKIIYGEKLEKLIPHLKRCSIKNQVVDLS